MYTITTKRLVLRPFIKEDLDKLISLGSERKIEESIVSIPTPHTEEVAESWIDNHARECEHGSGFHFAIAKVEDDSELMGYIALNHVDRGNEEGQISFWIGEEFTNHGYTTEATKAVVEFGFSTLGLNRLVAYHMIHNVAASCILTKAGMSQEGQLRQRVRRRNTFHDVYVWSIIQSEWLESLQSESRSQIESIRNRYGLSV
jgi:[ribosomal protein S5]-alanine N-acetyltransferase